jgi:hypothetical protein
MTQDIIVRSGQDFVGLMLLISFAVVLFLLLREVFTWYWKLTKIVDLLEGIAANLAEIKKHLKVPGEEVSVVVTDSQPVEPSKK